MIELLALPGWQTPPRSLEDWVAQLEVQAGPVVVTRESTGASWIEVGRLRLRGYVVLQGQKVEAINFELATPDPGPVTCAVEAAAQALGWEVHPDDPDDAHADEDDEP